MRGEKEGGGEGEEKRKEGGGGGETEGGSGSRSVVSDSLPPRALHSPWASPGQNTGVGSPCLLQGIFPTQATNGGLLQRSWILYQLSPREASERETRRNLISETPSLKAEAPIV